MAKRTTKAKAKKRAIKVTSNKGKIDETSVARVEVEVEDKPKFEVPTVVVEGVEKPCFTEVDLLKLELMHEKIARNAEAFRAKTLEADKFEHDAILKVRKMRMEAKALEDSRHTLNDDKIRMLNELSDRYGIDFKDPDLTYNTDTRVIEVPQKPFKREQKGEQQPAPGGDG